VENCWQEILSEKRGRSVACSNCSNALPECLTAVSVLWLGVSRLSNASTQGSHDNGGRVERGTRESLELLPG
jgi:hypothetical protein